MDSVGPGENEDPALAAWREKRAARKRQRHDEVDAAASSVFDDNAVALLKQPHEAMFHPSMTRKHP
jgi:hypothetical protein